MNGDTRRREDLARVLDVISKAPEPPNDVGEVTTVWLAMRRGPDNYEIVQRDGVWTGSHWVYPSGVRFESPVFAHSTQAHDYVYNKLGARIAELQQKQRELNQK